MFAGRFTLEDVEGVFAANALDALSSLVDKSLVIKEQWKGVGCFRLHETIREYAALKLRDADEEAAVHEQCTAYYVKTCAQAGGVAARYRLAEWLEWTDVEIDNARSVLSRCLSLSISERTVDSHVRSILNKLGFNSRAQIASWIASSESQLTRRATQ